MSIIDKALAAITPPESEDARLKATAEARALAGSGDWLGHVLDHHDQTRMAFAECKVARAAADRKTTIQHLRRVLVGHSIAEEVVLYPALAQAGGKAHAALAYTEQTTAKMQMAELENIPASTQAWLDKLEHIEGAVLHHMFEEEKGWFRDLKAKGEHQTRLTARYLEEFNRYRAGP